MIQIVSTSHKLANERQSFGGVGGYHYQPETTVVVWSDGTRLVVEDQTAVATYRDSSYKLQRIAITLHDGIVEHWIRAISIRLQRDVPVSNRLADRVRNWNTDTSRAA